MIVNYLDGKGSTSFNFYKLPKFNYNFNDLVFRDKKKHLRECHGCIEGIANWNTYRRKKR